MNNIINKTNITAAALFVVGLFAGWLIFSNNAQVESHDHASEEVTEWTCSMHPQIRKSEPGACPLCGMDLIPVSQSNSSIDPAAIVMTEEAIKFASIQTIIVGSMSGNTSLRLFGKVKPNESSITTEAAHVPGRIEKLFVNTTGETVKRGQIIAKIYSPELVTAQKELLEAKKMKDTYPQLVEAAKEKLRYWKISNEQIEKILSSGEVQQNFNIHSHTNGVVLKRNVAEGDHIQEGTMLYEIVDLSTVWIQFDGYESQLPFLKIGATIDFTTDAVPGKNFTGKINFIDPIMDPNTRTSTVRVVYPNKNGELKPDMFVSGVIQAGTKNKEAITIPQTALLWTGVRSVVYVKQTSDAAPSFALREVTLGEKQGDQYQIKSGLEMGEEIVMNGAFTVDAAAQLAGKPSMMNPKGGIGNTGSHNHGNQPASNSSTKTEDHTSFEVSVSAKRELQPLFSAYLNFKEDLANDNLNAAKKSGISMQTALSKIDMRLFSGKAHEVWMEYSNEIEKSMEHIPHASDIAVLRKAFQPISNTMIKLANTFKPLDKVVFVQFCPMADDNKGASWLSLSDEIKNPYFGASMLSCGEVTNEIK